MDERAGDGSDTRLDGALGRLQAGDIEGAIRDLEAIEEGTDGFARGRLLLGNLQLGRRDVAAAERSYEAAVRVAPAMAAAWNNLGNVRALVGRRDAASDAFERALKVDPGYAEAWVNKASLAAGQQRHEAALEAVDRALECDPDLAVARRLRGSILAAAGRIEAAVEELRRAVDAVPDDVHTLAALGSLLARSGNLVAALAPLQRVLALQSDGGTAIHVALAECLLRLGRAAEAVPHLEAALAERPEDPDLLTNLAVARIEQGRSEDGAELLQRARRRAPGHVPAVANLIRLRGRAGDREGMLALARELLQAADRDQDAINLAVDVLLRCHRFEEAEEEVRRAITREDGPEVRFLEGLVAHATARTEDAITAYRVCLASRPQMRSARLHLADLHLQAGDLLEAERVIRAGLAVDPEWSSGLTVLGDACWRRHDLSEARAQFEHAVALEPANLRAWDGLVGVLREADDHASVVDAFRRAVAANPGMDRRQYPNLAATDVEA